MLTPHLQDLQTLCDSHDPDSRRVWFNAMILPLSPAMLLLLLFGKLCE